MVKNTTSTIMVNDENGKCRLNSDFGIAVQGVLAFTAFCILILKRCYEPKDQRRSVAVWFCDTSKQAIGAMLIHFANVFFATLSKAKDPCTWYFINYLLDTTVGLFVIWIALKIVQAIATRKGWIRLRMGEYGSPAEFKTWVYQCGAYIGVMIVEKCVILAVFQFKFWTNVKEIILIPFHGHPKIEVVIVVLIVPFVMNALMFWVVDNFLMRRNSKMLSLSSSSTTLPVHYNKYNHGTSDDEVVMRLIANESKDTLIDDKNSSDNEYIYRRSGSESGFK